MPKYNYYLIHHTLVDKTKVYWHPPNYDFAPMKPMSMWDPWMALYSLELERPLYLGVPIFVSNCVIDTPMVTHKFGHIICNKTILNGPHNGITS